MKKLYLLIPCLFITTLLLHAQQRRKAPTSYNAGNSQDAKFLEKQWWLGFKAGINLSGADVVTAYSALSPVNYTPSAKAYDNFKHPGVVAGLEVSFYYKGFSVSFQPAYRNAIFSYTNQYLWEDPGIPENRLELTYAQKQQIDYADFPLLFRYDFASTRLRPYVQVGAVYTALIDATKSVTISGIDYASGGQNEFTNEPIIVGAKQLFADYQWALIGGAGVNYHVGNIRVNLDLQYRKGMSLANSTENRYGNAQLAGVGDAMDDIKINSFVVTLGTLFPLRFLTKGYSSINLK
ncbi:MAG: PorT family protein [Cyclobacteriaceae bacterium]|nr:PorT family protein [Cyclobacteriaceae bacterium]